MNDTPFHYDLIADIHGRIDKLEALLARLGYHHDGTGYVPPAGRRALFLGDLIDPKPGHGFPGGVRATLRAVKTMHDRGHALVLMGNHELNAVCYHTPGRTMEWLRHHGDKNRAMHQGTLDDFPDHVDPAGEWRTLWMPWLKRLPIFLDLGGLRAVHACWHPQHIALLAGRTLEDDDFLHAAADKATPEGEAIEAVLKGIEVPLPAGTRFADHTGTIRDNFRARWWEAPDEGIHCRDLVFPANDEIPALPAPPEAAAMFQPYPADAPPVFFGHYFKPANAALHPERPNVACLDHSAAKEGPLVAYRWNGEQEIKPRNYTMHEALATR
jgi:hypothetical protein